MRVGACVTEGSEGVTTASDRSPPRYLNHQQYKGVAGRSVVCVRLPAVEKGYKFDHLITERRKCRVSSVLRHEDVNSHLYTDKN